MFWSKGTDQKFKCSHFTYKFLMYTHSFCKNMWKYEPKGVDALKNKDIEHYSLFCSDKYINP